MNTKILRILLLAATFLLCISAVAASDVNITDSDSMASSDDANIQLDDGLDFDNLNSNTLSTDNDDTSKETISKNQTELTKQSTSTYYKGTCDVSLMDLSANATLSNKVINFAINNVNYTATTNNEGIASLNIDLAPGKYAAIAYFEGDDSYDASNNLTFTLEVLSTIKANDISKYYKANDPYTATFFDSQGNALANRDVTITVNGKSYTRKTNSNGVASLSVDLQPGTYKVVSTDPITGYKLTTTFKILSTISAGNVKTIAGENKKFSAKFLKSNGKALAKSNVKFKLNGKTYKVKTNSKGIAKLSLKNLNKGKYKVVCYNKDGLTKTYTVKVYNKVATKLTTNPYTFLKSDTKKVKVTLTDSLGDVPPSGKVVKFTINGKVYSKKTNSKGVATLKLPSLKKGVYTVKYKFDGATHYKASSASDTVTVLSTRTPSFSVKSTTSFGYGAGTPFKVAVTAGGVPLVKRSVTFKINGDTFVRSTDKNGIASLPINLEIGNYTVEYSIQKESKVDAKSASSNIIVKKRELSTLTWKSGTSFKDSSQSFKILLSDANGKAISGQTVKLTINSKTYTGTTASDGYVTIKANVGVGTYSVLVKFDGSNEYLSNSTKSEITVTASNLIKGVNEKNTISDLSSYLKSSSNCQVGNSKIKSLVNSLISGLTSDLDKATAIFNYVRDRISYSFYYDTNYGAVGTYTAKKGNCVDHSHLLVAMFRTAGLPARYVHGKCTFSSGSTYGHVWAQVLIGDTWICADATSSRNSLGNIVNWNTKSFTLNARYVSLPF